MPPDANKPNTNRKISNKFQTKLVLFCTLPDYLLRSTVVIDLKKYHKLELHFRDGMIGGRLVDSLNQQKQKESQGLVSYFFFNLSINVYCVFLLLF